MERNTQIKKGSYRRMGIKNKRGMGRIFVIFLVLVLILLVAFVGTVALAGIKWASNQISPVAQNLGTAQFGNGTLNFSDVGRQTFGTLDTVINLLPLLTGFAYFIFLVGCLVLALAYRTSANPVFMGLFIAFVFLLIAFAILMSNAYQDLYDGSDTIALELQAMTINSFLILNSPFIFGAVAIFSGIFLFSGKQTEDARTYGY